MSYVSTGVEYWKINADILFDGVSNRFKGESYNCVRVVFQ